MQPFPEARNFCGELCAANFNRRCPLHRIDDDRTPSSCRCRRKPRSERRTNDRERNDPVYFHREHRGS
jgi:hypothetical protein